jgi:hypothetical protein
MGWNGDCLIGLWVRNVCFSLHPSIYLLSVLLSCALYYQTCFNAQRLPPFHHHRYQIATTSARLAYLVL